MKNKFQSLESSCREVIKFQSLESSDRGVFYSFINKKKMIKGYSLVFSLSYLVLRYSSPN